MSHAVELALGHVSLAVDTQKVCRRKQQTIDSKSKPNRASNSRSGTRSRTKSVRDHHIQTNHKAIDNSKVQEVREELEKLPQETPTTFNSTDMLRASLLKFYENRSNMEKFLTIVNRQTRVSLRLLDYFCVNYSRIYKVVYMVNDKYFDVHDSYRNQLKTYSKENFDPFRRNQHEDIIYNNETIDTTLAQLCSLRWMIVNNVLEYVDKHFDEISKDMKEYQQRRAEELARSPEKKRRSSKKKSNLSIVATRTYMPGIDTVTVTFD